MIDKKKGESIYNRSVDVIRSVQLKNGGLLATPKGERYPYVYPRDHAIIALGLLDAGLFKECRHALDFVFNSQHPNGSFPQRYDTTGKDASYKPIQIDGTALIIYLLTQYYKKTKDIVYFTEKWEIIYKAVKYIFQNVHDEKDLVYTPNSIHEFPPIEAGLEIWANATCYGALSQLGEIAPDIDEKHEQLTNTANKIKAAVLKYMWNPRTKSFMKNIRLKESSSVVTDIDASTLGLSEYGMFEDSNPKIKANVKSIEEKLWNKKLGGLCRYPKYEGRNNGGWGPWPHFTLMICRHYIRAGDKKNADRCLKWVLDISWKDNLPEHLSTVKEFEEYVADYTIAGLLRKDRQVLIDNARKHPMFKKGIAYITTPLTWPHAEFIMTWNLYKETYLKK